MQIQLSWIEPATGQRQQHLQETPIALGRLYTEMPGAMAGQRIFRIVLNHARVENFHALIDAENGQLRITDKNTKTGTFINGVRRASSPLSTGDRLQIGPYEILVSLGSEVTSLSAAIAPMRANRILPGEVCDKLVGLLFPRRCGRTSSQGCPHCRDGQRQGEPYFLSSERSLYVNYGNYTEDSWGRTYYSGGDIPMNFTDADVASLETAETDFEQDMGAS